jgi:CRP-like cAMP-binding protein
MPGPVKIETLKKQPLFKDMTDEELANLSPLVFEKTYSLNSTLFVEGMAGEVLYLILAGKVNITHKDSRNQEKILATLGEGEFLGEMSLVDNRPRAATARAAGDVLLLVMTKKSFNVLMEKYPAAALKVLTGFLRTAHERVRKANELAKQI